MKGIGWLKGLFTKNRKTIPLDVCIGEIAEQVFYKELAIQASINLISSTISMGEFLTYEKGKETRGDNYYLFNVEPNQNQNASKFWRDVISRLVHDNRCLVIQHGGMFYVADLFSVERVSFYENKYTDVAIDGYNLNNSYLESEVLYFELHGKKIMNVVEGLYKSYGKLISYSQDNYKRANAKRGTLKVPTNYPQTPKAQEELQKLLNERFKKFFEAEGGAVIPLTNGLEYEDIAKEGYKGGTDSRDTKNLIDDIFDFVATAFQIPPQLLKGNVSDTDKALDNFLTFCINPLAKLLTDEINRKFYGKKAYLERTYVKLDVSRVRSVNIREIAGALDVLTRIGAYSVNDSLRRLGMETIDEEWANVKWMTKNYETIDKAVEGGD